MIGDKWVEPDRLFVKWNGEPMNNQTPYGWIKEFCENNELSFYGIHSFQHRNNIKTPLFHKILKHTIPLQYGITNRCTI